MSKIELLTLDPVVCGENGKVFREPFSIDDVLNGLTVEIQCPASNPVLIEEGEMNGLKRLIFRCDTCGLNKPNPSE